MTTEQKTDRVLELFFRALKGEFLSAKELAIQYNVSPRSISRDITSLKLFLAEHRDTLGNAELVYSSSNHCYHLETEHFISNKELLAVTKVLIGCRPFHHTELLELIRKLKLHTSPKDKAVLEDLIRNEIYHYKPIHFDCPGVIDNLWTITEHISSKRLITVTYIKMDRSVVKRTLKPVSVVFSEYYYYLIAYDTSAGEPGVPHYYRIDRITDIVAHREHFKLTKEQEVDEGLLKKRSQFMWPGKLRRVRFEFSGPSVQAVLDRLPTSRVVELRNDTSIIEAEVYGDGIKMVLLSQGSWVKVLAPQELVDEISSEIQKMHSFYR